MKVSGIMDTDTLLAIARREGIDETDTAALDAHLETMSLLDVCDFFDSLQGE